MSRRNGTARVDGTKPRRDRTRSGGASPQTSGIGGDHLAIAGIMLDLLAREEDPIDDGADGDDPLDGGFGQNRPAGARKPIEPDVAAAAVLLGRALAASPELYERIVAGAPVAIFECARDEWVDPATVALRRCFDQRGPAPARSSRRRSAVPHDAGPAVVVPASSGRWTEQRGEDSPTTRAIRSHRPLLGVAGPMRANLPVEILRGCEVRLKLGVLDPALLALAVGHVVGSACRTTIEAEVAASVDPVDLRIAVHRARGADGSLDRLVGIVRSRAGKTADDGAGPRLSELRGYGKAAEWGLGVAVDLAAYRRGEIAWREVDPGVLLAGPPGTGKTTFAAALAREAGVPLIAGSLAQWQSVGEAHLGTTLSAMRAFFSAAVETAPCVALVDELDSFGSRNESARYRDYHFQVVNCFLECLDGHGGRAGVLLVGATNHPERIDPAILRAGRFDRTIEIQLPSLDDLAAILRCHLGADLPDADLVAVARRGLGGTGADCAAWVRRARGRARREGRPVVVEDLAREVSAAVEEVGPLDELRIAVHESGHATVAHALGLEVDDIALRSPAYAGGGVAKVWAPGVPTLGSARDVLAVLVGGRAAEVVVCGGASAGAKSDLKTATLLANDIHFRWGLGRRLAVRDAADAAAFDLVERELRSASRIAHEIVVRRRLDVERLAAVLLARRALVASEVVRLLGDASRTDDGLRRGRSTSDDRPADRDPPTATGS